MNLLKKHKSFVVNDNKLDENLNEVSKSIILNITLIRLKALPTCLCLARLSLMFPLTLPFQTQHGTVFSCYSNSNMVIEYLTA